MGAAMRDNQVAVKGRSAAVAVGIVALLLIGVVGFWPERGTPKASPPSAADLFTTTTAPGAGRTTSTSTVRPVGQIRGYEDDQGWHLNVDDLCSLLTVNEVRKAVGGEDIVINKHGPHFSGECAYVPQEGGPNDTVLAVDADKVNGGVDVEAWMNLAFGSDFKVTDQFDCAGFTKAGPEVGCARLVRYPNLGTAALAIESPGEHGGWSVSRLAFEAKGFWVSLAAPGITSGTDPHARLLALARLLASRLPTQGVTTVKKPCEAPLC